MVTQSQKECPYRTYSLCQEVSHFVLQHHSESHERSCVNKLRNISRPRYIKRIYLLEGFKRLHQNDPLDWVYSSFFLSASPLRALTFTFCLPFSLLVCTNTQAETTAAPTSCITVAQAVPQTCILALPVGALGNASSHSTYHGTHPLGIQNIGRFENQNCKSTRMPFVPSQRATVTALSKVLLNSWRDDAKAAHKNDKQNVKV